MGLRARLARPALDKRQPAAYEVGFTTTLSTRRAVAGNPVACH